MNPNQTPIWRSQLQLALANSRQFTPEACDSILSRFDTIAKHNSGGGELGFRCLFSAYAEHCGSNDDTESAVNAIKEAILKANREVHIETSGIERTRRAIEVFNKNLDKLAGAVEIDGVPLSLNNQKINLPGLSKKQENYTAVAKYADGKQKEFGISVKF